MPYVLVCRGNTSCTMAGLLAQLTGKLYVLSRLSYLCLPFRSFPPVLPPGIVHDLSLPFLSVPLHCAVAHYSTACGHAWCGIYPHRSSSLCCSTAVCMALHLYQASAAHTGLLHCAAACCCACISTHAICTVFELVVPDVPLPPVLVLQQYTTSCCCAWQAHDILHMCLNSLLLLMTGLSYPG